MWQRREHWEDADVYRIFKLLESEHEKTAEIIDAFPLPVAVISPGHDLVQANAAFRTIFPQHKFLALAGREDFRDAVARTVESREPVYDVALSDDTTERATLLPLAKREGHALFVLSACAPAAATARAAPRPENIVELLPVAAIAAAADGHIVAANGAAALLTGIPSERLIGSPVRDLLRRDPPVPEQNGDRFEARIAGPGGKEAAIEVTAGPYRGGTILLLSAPSARPGSPEAMQALERSAGQIAHRFNNLLTVIISYSDMILKRFGSVETLRQDILPVIEAANSAAELTSKLLTFARGRPITASTVALEHTLQDLRGLLEGQVGTQTKLTYKLAKTPSFVRIGTNELETVILNLVENARDAIETGMAGEVTIRTSRERAPARGAFPILEPPPGGDRVYVCLAVTDSGRGIAPDVLVHIFEPLFSTKEGVAGMGLPVVYGIVKRAEGAIAVDTCPEKGTTVYISLPEVSGPAPETFGAGGR